MNISAVSRPLVCLTQFSDLWCLKCTTESFQQSSDCFSRREPFFLLTIRNAKLCHQLLDAGINLTEFMKSLKKEPLSFNCLPSVVSVSASHWQRVSKSLGENRDENRKVTHCNICDGKRNNQVAIAIAP